MKSRTNEPIGRDLHISSDMWTAHSGTEPTIYNQFSARPRHRLGSEMANPSQWTAIRWDRSGYANAVTPAPSEIAPIVSFKFQAQSFSVLIAYGRFFFKTFTHSQDRSLKCLPQIIRLRLPVVVFTVK